MLRLTVFRVGLGVQCLIQRKAGHCVGIETCARLEIAAGPFVAVLARLPFDECIICSADLALEPERWDPPIFPEPDSQH